jgi:aminoglycoside phosphotransferase (APT) family kinase protein
MTRMHEDEVGVTAGLVRRLVADQFPQWSELPVEPVASSGTDNALFRLGSDLVARFPRIHWAVDDVAKEQHWLPRIAPRVPLRVPMPVALGAPDFGYPHAWSVYEWMPGRNPTAADVDDTFIRDLADFVIALHGIEVDEPPIGTRGVTIVSRDDHTRNALANCVGLVDVPAVEAVWSHLMRTAISDYDPVLLHADLTAGNLLVVDGRLSAVIDFGALVHGDPAVEVLSAWELFDPAQRETYRTALRMDEVTWNRGAAWALSIALVALPYYVDTAPAIATRSRTVIAEVLAEYDSSM